MGRGLSALSRLRGADRRPVAALLVVALTSFALLDVLVSPVFADDGDPTGTLIVEESFDTLPDGESSWRFGGTYSPHIATEDGSNRLRLTPVRHHDGYVMTDQSGFAIYDRAQPTGAGLDVTFSTQQWGGTGADGIAFFLVDGETEDIVVGTAGGDSGM